MPSLKDKIKLVMDEARMLVLVAQILLGFEARVFLQKSFDSLSRADRIAMLVAFAVLLAAVSLLMWPAAFHQISEAGNDTADTHRIATRALCWALFPFALSLAIVFFIVTRIVAGAGSAWTIAGAMFVAALFLWYGWEFLAKKEKELPMESQEPIELHNKIDQVLTEIRVVIPGAQALLGFQFIAVFNESFAMLPRDSKAMHFAAMILMAIATMLFMTPAAYHRIVERGEDTERFFRIASRMLLAGMAAVALGLSAQFYVATRIVSDSVAISTIAAAISVLAFAGLWFGYSCAKRLADAARNQPALAK
jgi:hypothetical protein